MLGVYTMQLVNHDLGSGIELYIEGGVAISKERIVFKEDGIIRVIVKEFNGPLNITVEENVKGRLVIESRNDKRNAIETKITLKKNAELQREVLNLSAGVSRVDCFLEGERASFTNKEIHFNTNQQQTENKINVYHKASNTKSLVKIKSVLKNASRNFTHGMVRVEKDIENVNTYLSAHALLLDKDAQALAIPALEIESADVQAGHSASVSTIDEDQLFYLTTRGLSLEDAKKEIVKGFLVEEGEEETKDMIEGQWQQSLMLNV